MADEAEARCGVRRAISVRQLSRGGLGRDPNVLLLDILSLLTIAQQQDDDPYGFMRMMFVLAGFALLFYFLLLRPHKKREEEMRRMVESIKENDRVVTVGGIHGVVTNVQRDADRVTLRVDEATGTKIRVGLSAIARVVTDDKPSDTRREKETKTEK